MKIQLAPGEKLIIGFYIPADQQEDRGWSVPTDVPLDGEFTVEYGETAITITSDLPDDEGRGGDESLNDQRRPGTPPCSPVIYHASFGETEDGDVACE